MFAKRNEVRPYFAEYVQFGMLRFVRGQYACSVRFGGMLAFVLDGDVAAAVAGVERNISNNHCKLGMAVPGKFRPSAADGDNRVRETGHVTKPTGPFVIQHLFMAGDPKAPLRPPRVPKPPTRLGKENREGKLLRSLGAGQHLIQDVKRHEHAP